MYSFVFWLRKKHVRVPQGYSLRSVHLNSSSQHTPAAVTCRAVSMPGIESDGKKRPLDQQGQSEASYKKAAGELASCSREALQPLEPVRPCPKSLTSVPWVRCEVVQVPRVLVHGSTARH